MILKSKDGKVLMMSCSCGCDESIRFQIDKDDYDYYCFIAYMNGKFYAEQNETIWAIFRKKIKKIWSILRNKDYYYSDVHLTKDEFQEFKEYINSIE